MKSDEEIIRDYLGGQKESFDLLVDRYLKKLYSFFYRQTSSVEESSDLSQETFLRVWKSLKKFQIDKKFKVWLYKIAKNLLIDWYRKKKDVVFSKLDSDNESFGETIIDENLLPDEIFSKTENIEKLHEAIKKLRPDYKIIVFLHETDGLTFDEISEILDKPLNTVKSQYFRAILELRDFFGA